MKLIKVLLPVILVLVVLTTGYYFYNQKKVKNTKPLGNQDVKVGLAWLHQAQFAGFYVAKDNGYYQSKGLNVSLSEINFEERQIDDLVAKKYDFVIVNPIELLKAKSQGKDLIGLAVIYQDSPYAFAALKSSGIISPADFKSKRLGLKGGNEEAQIMYDAILSEYGILKKNVTQINLSFDTTEADDLISKTVDVVDLFRTDQTYLFKQKNVEYNLILPEKNGFPHYSDVLVTRKELINSNPEMVRLFVNESLKGWNYVIDNQAESAEITLKYATSKQYHDLKYQKYIIENSAPLIRPKGVQIGSMNYITWRRLYDALLRNKIIEKGFDVSSAYTTEFLR